MDLVQRTFLRSTHNCSSLLGAVLSVIWMMALLSPAPVQAQTSETRIEFLKYGTMATHVAQSPDGRLIAIGVRGAPTGGGRSQVVLWDQSLKERVWRRAFATKQSPDVAFDSTGARLAIAKGRGEVVIVRADDGQTVDSRKMNVPVEFRTTFETDASSRRLAFGLSASQAVFRSGDTQITFLNYKLNPTKKIETSKFCRGKVREIKLPKNSTNIYFTTQAYAECNPDYLCVINPVSNSLVKRYSRKNISQIEMIGSGEIAYSRGKYVYRFDLRSGAEEVVYTSDNTVNDLSYTNGRLVIANSDIIVLEM